MVLKVPLSLGAVPLPEPSIYPSERENLRQFGAHLERFSSTLGFHADAIVA